MIRAERLREASLSSNSPAHRQHACAHQIPLLGRLCLLFLTLLPLKPTIAPQEERKKDFCELYDPSQPIVADAFKEQRRRQHRTVGAIGTALSSVRWMSGRSSTLSVQVQVWMHGLQPGGSVSWSNSCGGAWRFSNGLLCMAASKVSLPRLCTALAHGRRGRAHTAWCRFLILPGGRRTAAPRGM
jgi:hypothetical protein